MAADDMLGRVKEKGQGLMDGLLGKDDSVADEDPDIEYSPAPKQEIMHDGMVVLSETQSEEAGVSGDGPAESHETQAGAGDGAESRDTGDTRDTGEGRDTTGG